MLPASFLPRIRHRASPGRWLAGVLVFPICAAAAGTVDPALPVYRPQPVPTPVRAGYVLPDGAVQIIGIGDMAGMVARWDHLFEKAHPGVKFHSVKSDALAALQSLTYDASALAPVGSPFLRSALGPYKILVKAPPFGIRVAHASLNPAAHVSPFAIVVPKSNPLDRISAGQVVRIFTVGDRRTGLTHWSQLGVSGTLGRESIHPWGLPASDHYRSADAGFADYFEWGRFDASPPPWNYESMPTYAGVAEKVARDPQAIGITTLNRVTSELKVLAVSGGAWSAPSRGDERDIQAGVYPYDRFLYLYVRRLPGQPLDPLVRDYLKLVLSREGQQAVAADPLGYLPLNATEAAVERRRLR